MKLNFEVIKNNTSPKNLEKAKDYIHKFQKITLQGDILRGEVQGSQKEIYEVQVCCTDNDYLKSTCTCPAQMDFCKHAAALCLTYLAQESGIKQEQTLPEQYILDMDETFLKEKLLSLLPEFPGLLEKLTQGSHLISMPLEKNQPQESDEDWESWEF